MKIIRKILVKLLGLKGYLQLVSRIYIRLISQGFKKEKYAELYFLKRITRPEDVVMDIGANLGYFSFFISNHIGPKGHLIAVEPIPLFAEIWKKNMAKAKYGTNYTMMNCALGSETKEAVTMAIPIVDGVVRHGLTKVMDSDSISQTELSFDVPMRQGDAILNEAGIDRLAFVKCDVEGYEQFVIPSLEITIEKFHPMFQIELSGEENRERVVAYLLARSYSLFILKDGLLNPIQKNDIFTYNQDFYFIHESSLNERAELIRN